MMFLKVPFAEKDEAKALGARWNPTRKCWYVPDGKPAEPFERWVDAGANATGGTAAGGEKKSPATRDAHGAKPFVGANYIALEHACNPFEVCAECQPRLAQSGWLAAHESVRQLLAGR